MKVYINSRKRNINAIGEYNKSTNELVVLKKSILSKDIACSAKFRGTKSIIKQRDGKVVDNVLIEDVKFKSPSSAANFVTGRSSNGLIVWKDKTNKSIKEILKEE